MENIKEEQSNEAAILWNQNYKQFCYLYINGIFVKTKSMENIKQERIFFSYQDKHKRKINNIAQIFKFDENNIFWKFCEQSFKQLFSKLNLDSLIPLIFFCDSDITETLKACSIIKKDILEYDFGNEISVFAFGQEYPNTRNLTPYFLFLYIPEKKRTRSDIQIILYQIYIFLNLICHYKIVIEPDDSFLLDQQKECISEIDKLSKIYFENSKSEKIFNSCSNIIVIRKNEEKFINIIGSLKFDSLYRFTQLNDLFTYCNSKFSEISQIYIITTLISVKDKIHDIPRKIINARFNKLKNDSKYQENKSLIIDDIRKESERFFPKRDIFFSNIFETELFKKAVESDCLDKSFYEKKLKEKSELNLQKLNQLSQKTLHSQKDIISFQQGHKYYLQKQFFEIIKESFGDSINYVYEELINVLESQIQKDNEEILNIFGKINEDNSEEDENFEEASRQGTNYVVKEVESTREIEINIESDENLENIIPQDF